jgi:hypothetical protein
VSENLLFSWSFALGEDRDAVRADRCCWSHSSVPGLQCEVKEGNKVMLEYDSHVFSFFSGTCK